MDETASHADSEATMHAHDEVQPLRPVVEPWLFAEMRQVLLSRRDDRIAREPIARAIDALDAKCRDLDALVTLAQRAAVRPAARPAFANELKRLGHGPGIGRATAAGHAEHPARVDVAGHAHRPASNVLVSTSYLWMYVGAGLAGEAHEVPHLRAHVDDLLSATLAPVFALHAAATRVRDAGDYADAHLLAGRLAATPAGLSFGDPELLAPHLAAGAGITDWILATLGAAQSVAQTNCISAVDPPSACVGATVTLRAGATDFDTSLAKSAAVYFEPCGIAGTIESWTGRAIEVSVPAGATSGSVWIGGRQLPRTMMFDAQTVAMLGEFLRGQGIPMPKLDIPVPRLVCIAPLRVFDAAGKQLNAVQLEAAPRIHGFTVNGFTPGYGPYSTSRLYLTQGESIAVVWEVEGAPATTQVLLEVPGAAAPLSVALAGASTFGAQAGKVQLNATCPCGTASSRAMEIVILRSLAASPAQLAISPGAAAVITFSLASPASQDITIALTCASTALSVPAQVVIPVGQSAVTATVLCAASAAPQGPVSLSFKPDDPTLVTQTNQVELWIRADAGMWSVGANLEQIAIHMALLGTGDLLIFSPDKDDIQAVDKHASRVYSTQFFGSAPVVMKNPRNLFCSGHCFLPDGRLLAVSGVANVMTSTNLFGELSSHHPMADHDVHYYDPASNEWVFHSTMKEARYYPACVTLPDGRAFVCAGAKWEPQHCFNDTFQIFDPATNVLSEPAPFWPNIDMYPFVLVLPGGALFVFSDNTMRIWDLEAMAWAGDAYVTSDRGRRTYNAQGAAVLLPLRDSDTHAEVLVIGGGTQPAPLENTGHPAANDALRFRFETSRPWTCTSVESIPLGRTRFMSDAVLLPDGTVLVVGGASSGRAQENDGPVRVAQQFDPATGAFSDLASAKVERLYHSSALLIPDGRVLTAGSTGSEFLANPSTIPYNTAEYRLEFFSPPSLFAGPRPTITWAPPAVTYGAVFDIGTPDAAAVTRVSFVRQSSVTHTLNTDQRVLFLAIVTTSTGQVRVTAPRDGSFAPPGHYLLFLLTETGTPSLGRMVRLG